MPFVFTCIHPTQSHYTTAAAQSIMKAVDRKRFAEVLVELSTDKVLYAFDGNRRSEILYILEFSTLLLRQLIVTLSTPKDLMQSYRRVLRFMIDLVRDQQSGAKFEHKSNILYPLIRGIIFHHPRDTRISRGGLDVPGIDEVFWSSGLIEEVLELVHSDDEAKNKMVDEKYRLSAMTSIFSLSRVVEFKVLLRDMGMLDVIINAYITANPDRRVSKDWDDKMAIMLKNMSQRDEIKDSLKTSNALHVLSIMISNYPQPDDAARLFSLIALAHIWGTDVDFGVVVTGEVKLKSLQTMRRVETIANTIQSESQSEGYSATRSRLMTESVANLSAEEKNIRLKERDDLMKAESKIAGKLLKDNDLGKWRSEKLIQGMQEGTATIKAAEFTIFLSLEDIIHAIQSISSNKEAVGNMGESSNSWSLYFALVKMLDPMRGSRARDPEENSREVLIKTLRSILNFTDVKELRDRIQKEDKRTDIERALKALKEKHQDDPEIRDLVLGVSSNLDGTAEQKKKRLDEAMAEDAALQSTGADGAPLFEVFLSHKRTE